MFIDTHDLRGNEASFIITECRLLTVAIRLCSHKPHPPNIPRDQACYKKAVWLSKLRKKL
jgi:hypothetical protein